MVEIKIGWMGIVGCKCVKEEAGEELKMRGK